MAKLTKFTLSLTAEAQAVLEASASPRKRGEFVSKLLVAYGAGQASVDAVDVESVKLQIMGLAGANKSLEARVISLERKIAGQKQAEDRLAQHRSPR